jgi:hypothetical protein
MEGERRRGWFVARPRHGSGCLDRGSPQLVNNPLVVYYGFRSQALTGMLLSVSMSSCRRALPLHGASVAELGEVLKPMFLLPPKCQNN